MTKTRRMIVIATMCALGLTGCRIFNKAPQEDVTPPADEQKAALLKQLESRYENPEAHYQLGRLYYAEGLLSKAEFEYRVALGFFPLHYPAQAATVKVLTDKRDKDAAGLAAEVFMKQAGVSADASLLLGQAFQTEGLDDYALACYRQAQQLAPDSATVFRQIGLYYSAKGDRVSAEENLRQSFELNPYQTDVAEELGRLGVIVQLPGR